jgi:FKBP-type peptidyl-prolyl cis-trans isomerase SlyD
MAVKAENSVVGIEYTLTEAGGSEVLDSNKGAAPLEFVMGKGQIIPGLEKGLVGMSEGDSADILVKAEEAYGLRDEEAVQKLPKEQFEGIELEKGMTLYGQGQQGETIQVTVLDFDDNEVTVDFNHPLAGKDLMFNVTVVSQRDATEQEAATGQVESSGCDDDSCGCGH